MALQLSIPIRLTIAGDGESDKIRIDLKRTAVQYIDGRYGFLPSVPDSILWLSIGGPGISPETPEMNRFVQAHLEESVLELEFGAKLLKDKEHYTVEIIFGYNGLADPHPAAEILP